MNIPSNPRRARNYRRTGWRQWVQRRWDRITDHTSTRTGCLLIVADIIAVGVIIAVLGIWISAATANETPDYLTATMRENAGLCVTPAVDTGLDLRAEAAGSGEDVANVGAGAAEDAPVPRGYRVAQALWEDGETAKNITQEICDRGTHLTDGQVYEIAHSIARYCRQYDIRPALVLSLISVESEFQINAASPTGDYGLMQLHGRPNLRGTIGPNIQAGVEHLARNMKAAGGDERRALSFYNGGGSPKQQSRDYADRVLEGVR